MEATFAIGSIVRQRAIPDGCRHSGRVGKVEDGLVHFACSACGVESWQPADRLEGVEPAPLLPSQLKVGQRVAFERDGETVVARVGHVGIDGADIIHAAGRGSRHHWCLYDNTRAHNAPHSNLRIITDTQATAAIFEHENVRAENTALRRERDEAQAECGRLRRLADFRLEEARVLRAEVDRLTETPAQRKLREGAPRRDDIVIETRFDVDIEAANAAERQKSAMRGKVASDSADDADQPWWG